MKCDHGRNLRQNSGLYHPCKNLGRSGQNVLFTVSSLPEDPVSEIIGAGRLRGLEVLTPRHLFSRGGQYSNA